MARAEGDIRVTIYDQEYRMRGRLDPDYIRELGQFVDSKMRSVAARTQTVDSLRVAVLAALNIADEYHQLKARQDAADAELDQKVDEYSGLLDQMLKQAG
ncbi:MAG TPA: cell division protein ZapA [Terriglobia bacterium]|nr:cell division protein ZapA [Terriglobia bacterium]